MKKISLIIYIVLSFLLFQWITPNTNCAGNPEQQNNDAHLSMKVGPSHTMDKLEKWVEIFEHPTRDEWQEPNKVIKIMNLKEGDIVADIGAGSGYFTRKFAKIVGPTGMAIGIDIEPELVRFMEEDARKLNYKNYKPRLAKMDDSGLAPGSVDVVFLCITYHHIDNRVAYMRKLLNKFKKGGRVILVEFYKRKMDFGPPANHKVAKQKVIEELKEAGYRLTSSLDFLRYQYFLEFEPNQLSPPN